MELVILIIVSTSMLVGLLYILHEISLGKYKLVNEESLVQIKSIKQFKEEFPNKDIKDLKIEIEKISDMLLDNQESNRYTKRIQEKAKNDSKIDEFRDVIPDSVQIIKYNQGKMQAQVSYINGKKEYILIMYMNIVKSGRAFLKNYKTLKRIRIPKEI